jgi:proline iminopeptidase
MTFMDLNGARLRLEVTGKGDPLVLLHGGPGIPDDLGPLASLLPEFQVLRFDQRGGGASSVTPPFDVPTLLADLEGLREHLGVETWVVAGHSWGADLALAYALAYPERTRALVSISGTGIQNDRDWKAAYERGVLEGRERHAPLSVPIREEVKRSFLRSWRELIKTPDLLRRLADSPVQALFLVGSEDIRPSWSLQQLAHLMPYGQFVCIDGAAHSLWETHPEELRGALSTFLSG